jgi:hypothetical protein
MKDIQIDPNGQSLFKLNCVYNYNLKSMNYGDYTKYLSLKDRHYYSPFSLFLSLAVLLKPFTGTDLSFKDRPRLFTETLLA